jgi:hypothetical protein
MHSRGTVPVFGSTSWTVLTRRGGRIFMGCPPKPTVGLLDDYLLPGPYDLFQLLPNDNPAIL